MRVQIWACLYSCPVTQRALGAYKKEENMVIQATDEGKKSPILAAFTAAKEITPLDEVSRLIIRAQFMRYGIKGRFELSHTTAGKTNVYWDYQDDRFVDEPIFGRTIWVATINPKVLKSKDFTDARMSADESRLAREMSKAIWKRINKERVTLFSIHDAGNTEILDDLRCTASHEIGYNWHANGYVTPETVPVEKLNKDAEATLTKDSTLLPNRYRASRVFKEALDRYENRALQLFQQGDVLADQTSYSLNFGVVVHRVNSLKDEVGVDAVIQQLLTTRVTKVSDVASLLSRFNDEVTKNHPALIAATKAALAADPNAVTIKHLINIHSALPDAVKGVAILVDKLYGSDIQLLKANPEFTADMTGILTESTSKLETLNSFGKRYVSDYVVDIYKVLESYGRAKEPPKPDSTVFHFDTQVEAATTFHQGRESTSLELFQTEVGI
jgi:hypothetical protein